MNKLLGIFIFLMILYVSVMLGIPADLGDVTDADVAALQRNHFSLGQRIGLEGILCLGAGLLIITGGIDLSIGSVVALCACVFCQLVLHEDYPVPIPVAAVLVVMLGCLIGLINGILVTYFQVQAFVVTLCGLFIYRGAARWISDDSPPRIGQTIAPVTELCRGSILYVPIYLWLLLILFALVTIFLHLTIYGRYFYAIGSNERAARYSGIHTTFYKILAYVLCSMFASIYALVHVIYQNSVEPSTTGAFLELYAIAGAVLGGCSLRGGEGTSLGMLIGTAIMKLLPNFTSMWEISSKLEPTVIGFALLFCAILDEMLRRGVTWRDIVNAPARWWARWFG